MPRKVVEGVETKPVKGDGESSWMRPSPWCPSLCNPKQMQFPRGDGQCFWLLSAEKSKAAAEATSLSLQGKVLVHMVSTAVRY